MGEGGGKVFEQPNEFLTLKFILANCAVCISVCFRLKKYIIFEVKGHFKKLHKLINNFCYKALSDLKCVFVFSTAKCEFSMEET